VVEVVSGRDFDVYLREHVLRPLDMHDTFYFVPESKRDRLAVAYEAGEGGALAAAPKDHGSETYFGGGWGLFSTARDYARFAQMLLNGGMLDGVRVVTPETVAAMTANQIGGHESAVDRKYGLGLGLAFDPAPDGGAPALTRYYWGGVLSTNFWVIPRRDLVIILMTQVSPTNHGGADGMTYRVVNAALEN
jgi:CubicO group peptidase (beta-lactamase class C family)